MYGIQDKINQILRGAETIRKNQSMQPLQPVNSTTTFFAGKEPEEKTNEVERLRSQNNKLKGLIERVILASKFPAFGKEVRLFGEGIEEEYNDLKKTNK